MAQRFKAEQLKEMIRSLVREEIKQVVAETINEVLSERYLRKLAESVAVSRPRGVASLEQMGDDAIEEPPPHPLANSREWPFDKHPMKHDDHVSTEHGEDQEDTDYRKRGDDPMSMFFEGVRPIPKDDEVDVEKLRKVEQAMETPEGKNTIGVWKKMMEGMDRVAARTGPASAPMTQEEAERRLAEKRKALEVKA